MFRCERVPEETLIVFREQVDVVSLVRCESYELSLEKIRGDWRTR